MKLKKLLLGVDVLNDISGFSEIDINKLSTKAQDNLKDSLFFCYQGKHNFLEMAQMAIDNGASVIVCEQKLNIDCYQVIVKDIRMAICQMAQTFFDTKDVKVIGVTGTNGKTSTTFIIKSILEKAGKKIGVIGTNGVYFSNTFIPASLTTPDPIDLHEIFAIMKKGKVDYVVMEVSAHAIHFKKVFGINFVCKIFTNLSLDHLDYFKDMQSYAKTKMSFFNNDELMVVNVDDEVGKEILNRNINAISYGIFSPADCFAMEVSRDGTKYILNISDNVLSINSKLFGMFNVYNCLASAVACYYLGVSVDDIKLGIESLNQVEGRFNVYKYKTGHIVIDYAHTPDGLENVLKTARSFTDGKLVCVFGCGGDRDKSKRKIMGAVAEKYADFCFITTDNPRYESPKSIIDDISKGFNTTNYYKVEDRKNAIGLALKSMGDGGTVIICGKGAENYIEIKGKKIPYSDYEVVKSFVGEI